MMVTNTSGQILGEALREHFRLTKGQRITSACLSALPLGAVTVTLTITLTPEDMAAIGAKMADPDQL